MPQNWTTSELGLAVHIDPGPRYGARLQEAVREAVRRGALRSGDSLPSSRELAAGLDVARGTVVGVYEQLVAEGYLVAEPGSRTRVAATVGTPDEAHADSTPAARLRFDLRPGVPELGRFPAADWAWAYAEAGRRVRSADLDYGDGRGHPGARDTMAAHLRRVRAADTRGDRMVLTGGFAQAAELAIRVLAARGVRVLAVEDPGDRSLVGIARAAGVTLAPIPVDDDGIDVRRVAASGAHAVVVTPAHQSPTGAVLAPHRRIELLEWAARTAGWIVEDDYDSEFRYDRQAVGALQGLAPDRTARAPRATVSAW